MKKIIISIICLISCIILYGKTYPCRTCNATGIIIEKITCETCNGKGYSGFNSIRVRDRFDNYGYIQEPIKCVRCGKVRTQRIQLSNKYYNVGVGTIQIKKSCESCNGKKWITEKDNDDNFKVLSFTKEQWQKIIKIVEINGNINLNKSKVIIKITDHEGF